MIKNEYTLIVDIKKTYSGAITPTFIQYDNAIITIKLLDGGKPLNLDTTTKVEFAHKRPDNVTIVGDGEVVKDKDGNDVVQYVYQGSEMSLTGFIETSLSVFTEDKKVSILPFKVRIVSDLRDETVDEASEEYGKLQQLTVEIQSLVSTAEKAIDDANEATLRATTVADETRFTEDYKTTTQYKKNNFVSFNGSTYMAKKDTKNVAPPTLPQTSNDSWVLVGRKGADGTGTVAVHKDVFVATAGQKVFNLTNTYDQFQNRINVTVGGVPQFSPDNFTETSNKSITFLEAVPTGVKVVVEYFGDAVPVQSDIQTTVNNHTTNLNNHAQRIGNVEDKTVALTQQLAETEQQLDGKIDLICVGGLQPHPMRKGKVVSRGDTPRILEIFDGYVWADKQGGHIYRRKEEGGEWELYTSRLPKTDAVRRILKTSDNEVILVFTSGLYKSTGWPNPNSVTWSEKLLPYGKSYFLRESISGNGTKFIVTSYAAGTAKVDYPDSRYVHVSVDNGNTWTLAYDSVLMHGQTLSDNSHIHAVAYDEWSDRFYVSEGHGPIAGIYVSVDNGATWKRAPKMALDASPMSITPTDDGLVCGSDHAKTGIFGVLRMPDPMDEELVHVWKWDTGFEGVVGFPHRGYRDPLTGIVYISFRSNFPNIKPIIAAGTPTSGGLVYTWDSGGVGDDDRIDNVLVTKQRELLALGIAGSNDFVITGKITPPGTVTIDNGNVVSGKSERSDSIAVGFGSEANGGYSVAIGVDAKSDAQSYGVTIGHKSKINSSNSVAIGGNTEASSNSVIIGQGAKSAFSGIVALGMNSEVTGGGGGVAIGENTKGRSRSVAIGQNATNLSGSTDGVAIGANTVSHNQGVALGAGTSNTLSYQVAVGPRHFEIGVLANAPANNTPPDHARLFFRKNGSNKVELCIQFSGVTNPLVVATQP